MNYRRVPVGDFILGEDEKRSIQQVIDGGRISEWEKVKEFEKIFSDYIGTNYCLAVSSGTAALLVGLLALIYDERFPKVRKGAMVITSPVTYASTINAIILSGLEPVFVDIDANTFKLKVDQIENAIKKTGPKKIAGILPVHLMGYPNEMDEINDIASKYDLFVFEDSAQAHGSVYKGRKTGSLGLMADFSFYIAHNIQAGEMGCITLNDQKLYALMRQLKANGRVCNCLVCTRHKGHCPGISRFESNEDLDPRFTHEYVAYNFKTTEFAPALAIPQINKAGTIISKRHNNVKYLNEKLKKYNDIFELPIFDKNVSYLAYPITIRKNGKGISRRSFRQKLEEYGVENRPLFGCMPTQQPAFLRFKAKYQGKLPNAEFVGKHSFYIGCHQYLEKKDLDHIVRVFDLIIENEDV